MIPFNLNNKIYVGLAIWLGLGGMFSVRSADESSNAPALPSLVRVAIGPGTWGGVNRNDASAAISVWAKAIMQQRGSSLNVQIRMFDTPEALGDALKRGEVDGVSMLTDQFLTLDPKLLSDTVYLVTKDHAATENYVLLTDRDTGLETVPGLAGRKLLVLDNARTALALPWLETELARGSLGPAKDFFRAITKIENPSKAVLQVFFHQADACLVTSNVFELACELNPQLHQKLRVLAISPAVVPGLFCFRSGYTPGIRDQMESAMMTLNQTPSGLQVLTVFQSDGMVKQPLASLDSTRQLLAEYQRVKTSWGISQSSSSPSSPLHP
jgi:phosphonate transport system substrate-binding protein